MRSRPAALAVLGVVLGIASPTVGEELDARIGSVRLSERGSGGFYNLIVHAHGADAFRVAAVRVGAPGESLELAVPVAPHGRRVGGRGRSPQATLAAPLPIEATLHGADGAALGAPRAFVADGAGRARPGEGDAESASPIDRLVVGEDADGLFVDVQVDADGASEATSVRLVVGDTVVVDVPLAPSRAVFRAVVVLEDRALGVSDPVAVWMLDAEGAPLGAPQQLDVVVEPARG